MKKILYTIILLITIATYSQEKTDWTLIEDSETERILHRLNTKNTAWIQTSYKNDDKMVNNEPVRSSLVLIKFDCRNEKYAISSERKFNENKKVIYDYEFSDGEMMLVMKKAVPNSNAKKYLEAHCKIIRFNLKSY
jgi:hypothetical protein